MARVLWIVAGVILVVLQVTLLETPWRSYILATELVAGMIAIMKLHVRVRFLEFEVAEHRERLDGIQAIVNRAAVVSDARKIVEQALTISLRDEAPLELLDGDTLQG